MSHDNVCVEYLTIQNAKHGNCCCAISLPVARWGYNTKQWLSVSVSTFDQGLHLERETTGVVVLLCIMYRSDEASPLLLPHRRQDYNSFLQHLSQLCSPDLTDLSIQLSPTFAPSPSEPLAARWRGFNFCSACIVAASGSLCWADREAGLFSRVSWLTLKSFLQLLSLNSYL